MRESRHVNSYGFRKRVAETVDIHNQKNIQALIIEELRRLHEGVLARYYLRISDYQRWKEKQKSG